MSTTDRQFFLERRRAEHPAFVRVFQALPADQLDYRPHEKSSSAHQIAWGIVGGVRACVTTATDFSATWQATPAPQLAELIAEFERLSGILIERVSAMSDAEWERHAQFWVGERMVNELPVREFLWFIHFDGIHHRGQLSAYLRPMGGKVPAIYGPSGDERP